MSCEGRGAGRYCQPTAHPVHAPQMHNAREAAQAVKQLVDAGYRVCCTHGNGPQARVAEILTA